MRGYELPNAQMQSNGNKGGSQTLNEHERSIERIPIYRKEVLRGSRGNRTPI